MRKNPTQAEAVLWNELRLEKLGVNFRQQHPIGKRIFDFYCHEARLAIEVDGGIHQSSEQKEHDRMKEELLHSNQIRLLRFRNEDVLNRLPYVMEEIQKHLTHTSPSPIGGRARDRGNIGFYNAMSMQQAVSLAKQHTTKGKICLLSTASPSYGMFKNFEEKGDIFKQEIFKTDSRNEKRTNEIMNK